MSSVMRNIVAGGLVLIAVACVVGAIVLARFGHPVPSMLEVTGGVAVGALARVIPSDRADPPPEVPAGRAVD